MLSRFGFYLKVKTFLSFNTEEGVKKLYCTSDEPSNEFGGHSITGNASAPGDIEVVRSVDDIKPFPTEALNRGGPFVARDALERSLLW